MSIIFPIVMAVVVLAIVVVSVELGDLTEKAVRKYYGIDDEEK